MSKIIALSGSHGVGKTSLINKLHKDLAQKGSVNSPDIHIFNEINSGLYNIGFSLNGKAIDFSEVMFSQKCAFDLSYNLIKYYASRTNDQRIVFLDRSCIDTFIYSKYFFIQHNSPAEHQNLIDDMDKKSLEVISEISTHWLLPPFADFDAKKERMDIDTRDQIWQQMQDYFKANSTNSYVLKANNTNERFKEIFNALYTNKNITFTNKLGALVSR